MTLIGLSIEPSTHKRISFNKKKDMSPLLHYSSSKKVKIKK